MKQTPVHVLMVCLGNICRSPTAEAVLRSQVEARGLENSVIVDSAGTSDWHVNEAPDARATMHAEARGYNLRDMKGRQFTPEDAARFDYILAMDKENLRTMLLCTPPAYQEKIHLLLSYGDSGQMEVPDPYYSGADGFELVLDLVEEACAGLLETIVQQHRLT